VKLYASQGGGAWKLVKSLKLGDGSSVTSSWKPAAVGTLRLQARWAGDASNKANISATLSVSVN
jgi:hypothetical protein